MIANQRTSSLAPDDPGTPPAKRNRPSTLPPLPADLLAGLEARGLLYLAALIDRRSSWFHETYHDQEAREVFYRYLLIHPRLQAPIQTLYAEIVPEGAYLTINPRLLPLADFREEHRGDKSRVGPRSHPLPRLELILDVPRPPQLEGRLPPLGYRIPSVEEWAARGNAALQAAQVSHLALITISY
ncbi:MAG TPA: hypothetical protein VNL71_17070 [Chloroflexota bacterium]|nr:hypothetical protein [Chloroflexota bacterium]